MKRITVELEDEGLYEAVETEASKSGRSVDQIVKEALEQWLAESELNEDEADEIESARNEWREQGGIKASEFFGMRNLKAMP